MIESSYLRRSVLQIVQNTVDSGASERHLQSNSTGTYNNGSGVDSGGDRYEFVAFLLWYIFLVLCCVVPTCCAYHRRRMMEQRLALHRTTMRQNSNSLFFLSGLQQQSANRPRNPELVQQERVGILREELKRTTMVRDMRGLFFCCVCSHILLLSHTCSIALDFSYRQSKQSKL